MGTYAIFDSNNMPKRAIRIKKVISNTYRPNGTGELICAARRAVAMEIANKIVNDQEVFHIRELYKLDVIEVVGDCIILTSKEYEAKLLETFDKGRELGMRSMRII